MCPVGDYDAYLKDEKTVPLPKEPKNKRTKLSKIQDILKGNGNLI